MLFAYNREDTEAVYKAFKVAHSQKDGDNFCQQ